MIDVGHTGSGERARAGDAVDRCRRAGTTAECQYRRDTSASDANTGIDVRPTA